MRAKAKKRQSAKAVGDERERKIGV